MRACGITAPPPVRFPVLPFVWVCLLQAVAATAERVSADREECVASASAACLPCQTNPPSACASAREQRTPPLAPAHDHPLLSLFDISLCPRGSATQSLSFGFSTITSLALQICQMQLSSRTGNRPSRPCEHSRIHNITMPLCFAPSLSCTRVPGDSPASTDMPVALAVVTSF